MEDNSNDIELDILSLLTNLELAAQKPAKQRTTKVSTVVDKITSVSYQNGLSALALDKLIDLIVLPNELDQSSRACLVRNLYPIDKVSNSVFFRIVASLGHGVTKAPYSTQVMLLKWLILTHDMVEDQTVFSQVYSILFNLLDTAAIRLPLCHLLSIITRRRHVRPFRIQLLMELIQQTGSEPSLIGLYKVFKVFVPDVIICQKVNGRAPLFTDLDPEWRGRLCEIQKKAHFLKTHSLASEENGCRLFQRRGTYANKLPKLGLPETESSYTQESSITLDEIENIQDLVGNLEKIHVPNQLVAMLGDPLLQKFLQLKSSGSDLKRIDNWLLAFFEDKMLRSVQDSDVSEMLQLTLEYTRFSKKLPPACDLYLKSIIPTWDGLRDRDFILDLLAYTHLDSFQNLLENLFSPLEDAVLSDGSIGSKLALLKFYTALLYRWTVEHLLQSESASIIEASIMPLVKHANDLALTTLQNSSSVSTVSVILNFYETVAALTQNIALNSSLSIVLPNPEAIYLLCFTSSLSVLSRIFGVLAIYKRLFEYTPIPGHVKTTTSCLKDFNAYLIDICNCIWRDRAFNTNDLNSKGCLLSPLIIDALNRYLIAHSNNLVSLESSFNLSFSPVTCLLAKNYFKREENQQPDIYGSKCVMADNGPITQTYFKNLRRLRKEELQIDGIVMSWQDYKLGVLDYLEEKGAPGISDLMHSTLKNLSNRPRDK
ncbi:Centromere protein I [Erysiphe neolycopersici]|uniref:Centromere protein I n=1 Tax=Erysiphe neolycopersici TaxID=212602 RepID=A0A420HQ66_9PEZI|nr:Centromere protein I [Erysiphe neolycopersici]